MQEARGRDCTGLRRVGMPSCAESQTIEVHGLRFTASVRGLTSVWVSSVGGSWAAHGAVAAWQQGGTPFTHSCVRKGVLVGVQTRGCNSAGCWSVL